MNTAILRHPQIRLILNAGFICITILVFFLHSVRAFAASTDTYEYEYERTDIPTSAIKRGQKLGAFNLKQQTLTVWRNVDTTAANPPVPVTITTNFTMRSGSGPGGKGPNDDDSVGLLIFTRTSTETRCNYYQNMVPIIEGLKAYPTHNRIYTQGYYFYSFKVTIPRTKIADVVVNDPAKALTHAGKTVQKDITPTLYPRMDYTSLYVNARSPMMVLIGETPPAVFFPLHYRHLPT